jgi:hypothetical protein
VVLWCIGVAIVSAGAITRGLGFSILAALLAMILVTALSFVPTLLALEALQRQRHPELYLRERGEGERRA